MFGAGHIRYYLQKWRNLNHFQNQGWEAYNAMIASFWHHRTKRGGGGKNAVDRSKIKPIIARWIMRLMLWRTGAAREFFQSLEAPDESGSESESESESDSDNDNENSESSELESGSDNDDDNSESELESDSDYDDDNSESELESDSNNDDDISCNNEL
jgi:hypothetical protein